MLTRDWSSIPETLAKVTCNVFAAIRDRLQLTNLFIRAIKMRVQHKLHLFVSMSSVEFKKKKDITFFYFFVIQFDTCLMKSIPRSGKLNFEILVRFFNNLFYSTC